MSFVRAILLLLGIAVLLLATLLYEDEEKKLRPRLEALWIRLDDAKKLSIGRRQRELQVICAALLRLVNAGF